MTEARRVVVQQEPYNAEVPLPQAACAPGEAALFVRSHFAVPALDAGAHRLQVDGALDRPLSLSVSGLARWPRREVAVTLECAGNGRSLVTPRPPGMPWGLGAAGSAVFEGVSLADILEAAGPSSGAMEVLACGADAGQVASGRTVAYERSLPLAVALRQDVLVAHAMNGAPLSPEHGYPMRLVVPGWYGVASVKWLARLEVRRTPFTGWFQTDTYVYDGEAGLPDGTPVGPMRVRALITSPGKDDVLARGAVLVRGVAWSGSGSLCREAHAPIWLSRGRVAKYRSASSSGTGVTSPSMRT